MKSAPYLSVVIPVYNEEENIKKGVLDAVFSFLHTQKYTYEILLIDDGSSDKSKELLKQIVSKRNNSSLISVRHQGKAGAVTTGMLKANGSNILFTDFDQATPISEVEKLIPYLKNHDVVIGSRAGRRSGAPLSRLIMARGFMFLRKLILGIEAEDTQCGFKMFSGNVAQKLFKRLRLYQVDSSKKGSRVTAGFDVEILFLARKLGFSVKEVPVEWRYVETRRVNPIRDSVEGLRDLLRIRIMDMRGKYD